MTAHDVRSGTLNDIDSLRAQSTRTLTVATVAGAATWLSALALRVPNDDPHMWALPASLAAVGLLALWLQPLRERAGRMVYLAGLVAVLVLNLHLDPELQSAYFMVLVVLASSAVAGPSAALCAPSTA